MIVCELFNICLVKLNLISILNGEYNCFDDKFKSVITFFNHNYGCLANSVQIKRSGNCNIL